MQVPMLIVIIVGIVAILIGWGIGFADSNLRSSKKIRAAESKAEAALQEAQNKIADAESRLAAAAGMHVKDDPGLLRLKDEDGRLTLEMDGRHINATTLTAEEKKRLIGLLTLVRPWLEGQPVEQPAPRPIAPVRTPPTPVSSPQETPGRPAAALEPKPEPTQPAPALSIVAQINAILQERIMNTPLAKQSIRLQQTPDGEVEVWVGLKKYAAVEDIQDPDVKSALHAAIAEWEQKYTPGL